MKTLFKSQFTRRTIAMCLAFLLAFMNPSMVQALESGIPANTGSAEDMEISDIPFEQEGSVSSGDSERDENIDMPDISGEEDQDTSEEENSDVLEEGNPDISEEEEPDVLDKDILTVSNGDLDTSFPLREPEHFYQDAVAENYGELVGYDTYSRTYHVGGKQYITVIGNDAATYIDEMGALRKVDNTLIANPIPSLFLDRPLQ